MDSCVSYARGRRLYLSLCFFLFWPEYTVGLRFVSQMTISPGGVLGLIFAGYVPLASQNPYPIIVYSVAKYRSHLSHFWEDIIFTIPTL